MQVRVRVVATKPDSAANKFCSMENPFKPGDAVLTFVKRIEVEATVKQVWKQEVQVKVKDSKLLLWRTQHTVWYPGSAPIPKEPKAVASPVVLVGTPAMEDAPKPERGPETPPEHFVENSAQSAALEIQSGAAESAEEQAPMHAPSAETTGVAAPRRSKKNRRNKRRTGDGATS